jgi:hypothetical protein
MLFSLSSLLCDGYIAHYLSSGQIILISNQVIKDALARPLVWSRANFAIRFAFPCLNSTAFYFLELVKKLLAVGFSPEIFEARRCDIGEI